MVPRMAKPKRLVLAVGDVMAVCLANLLAIALRFDFSWSGIFVHSGPTLRVILLDVILTPLTFSACGLYQGYWKYTGLDDLVRLARAVAYRTVAVIVAYYGLGFYGLSRAVVIMSTILLLLVTGALRVAPRFRFEFFSARNRGPAQRCLIVGAGDTGESLLRELRKGGHLALEPIGFVDDDPEKMGAKIHGVPVLGRRKNLEALILAHGVQEVVIAIPGASSAAMQEIFAACVRTRARFRTVPTRGELDRGAARISQIRTVALEDLLGRDVIDLDQHVLRERLSGRRILITGAAGSIGREIARQAAAYAPAELIVLDRNENSLFYLEAELRDANPLLPLTPVVSDVCDRRRLEILFRETRPEVVFHAAAYKHVPLMEQNPLEAIKNNVLATRHLAETAIDSGVDRFIFISTDKAVRPTSVMGATKRLCEHLIKSLPVGRTRFMAVRFGNVLGSDGSVVPTFRRQIAAGGPVTVTHRDATRYFMTIPEAVQLVLMAGSMGNGGEIFLLQMGEPVRIVDLATNLIELSGLRPGQDVEIAFTGLRPGEKIHEELIAQGEATLPTPHEKILVLSGVEPLDRDALRQMRLLEEAAREGQAEEALALLRALVPEYERAATTPAATTENVVDIYRRRRPEAQV
jgi:FlaA1/EpsC-like NDP-sugar epimerase